MCSWSSFVLIQRIKYSYGPRCPCGKGWLSPSRETCNLGKCGDAIGHGNHNWRDCQNLRGSGEELQEGIPPSRANCVWAKVSLLTQDKSTHYHGLCSQPVLPLGLWIESTCMAADPEQPSFSSRGVTWGLMRLEIYSMAVIDHIFAVFGCFPARKTKMIQNC